MEVTLVHPDNKSATVVATTPIQLAAYTSAGFVEASSAHEPAKESVEKDSSEVEKLKKQLKAAEERLEKETEARKVAEEAAKEAQKDAEVALKAAEEVELANQGESEKKTNDKKEDK